MNNIFIMKFYLRIVLVTIISFATCRDFYVGMFKRNDWLVAQDHLYKDRIPYKYMYAKYGRIFKCKITYFRVSDRLGYGRGPKVEIVRGGLNLKYLVLRLTSPYNKPISVNIYVGCANTFKPTKTQENVPDSNNTTEPTTVGSLKSDGLTTVNATCTGNCTNSNQTVTGSGVNLTTVAAG